jgi:hypothetical protein
VISHTRSCFHDTRRTTHDAQRKAEERYASRPKRIQLRLLMTASACREKEATNARVDGRHGEHGELFWWRLLFRQRPLLAAARASWCCRPNHDLLFMLVQRRYNDCPDEWVEGHPPARERRGQGRLPRPRGRPSLPGHPTQQVELCHADSHQLHKWPAVLATPPPPPPTVDHADLVSDRYSHVP